MSTKDLVMAAIAVECARAACPAEPLDTLSALADRMGWLD